MRINGDELQFGDLCTIGFERTLRIPSAGRAYPLPPGLGTFQLHDLSHHPDVPAAWKRRGSLVIGLASCEALWLCFSARWWHPCAIRIGLDGTNVLTGRSLRSGLSQHQDYLACPDQPWLVAHCPRPGEIAQFVTPAGPGDDGTDGSRDLQITVYPPLAGTFGETAPDCVRDPFVIGRPCELMVGPGQDIRRCICPDAHGHEVWDQAAATEVHVQIVSLSTLRVLTGTEPEPSPICRRDYEMYGIPWLEEYEDPTA